MTPVVCIVGNSSSGKTTLTERLITEMKSRGYKVAAAKHTRDEMIIDKRGKDSWRLVEAGGDQVLLFSPGHVFMDRRQDKDLSVDEAMLYVTEDADLFIAEGYRKDTAPKIAVHRKERGEEAEWSRQGLLAVVTDEPLDVQAPQFSWDDIKGVADLVERKLLSHREDLSVSLFVNGAPVRLNEFVRKFVATTVEGMLASLKDVGPVQNLELRVYHKAIAECEPCPDKKGCGTKKMESQS